MKCWIQTFFGHEKLINLTYYHCAPISKFSTLTVLLFNESLCTG
nr:MAG TPA: hypothetical protein [Caudoviricetes sp.]